MVYTVEPIVMLMEVQFLLWEQATWNYYGCGLSLAASWLVQDNSCCWSRLFGVSMDVVLCSKLIV